MYCANLFGEGRQSVDLMHIADLAVQIVEKHVQLQYISSSAEHALFVYDYLIDYRVKVV